MNQLINITQNENNDSVVSARELHDFLDNEEREERGVWTWSRGLEIRYTNWVKF